MARFFRRGKSKVMFLPAVAGASPTRPEITAGTDLTEGLAEVRGFNLANSPIPTPDMATEFTTTITGEDTVDNSGFTFYDDDTATTVRTALAKGTAGFVVLFPYGDVPTKRCEVWPVRSAGVNDEWTAANEPARFSVDFATTAAPTQDATVPA